MKLLLVEDVEINKLVIDFFCIKNNINLTWCKNGKEALEILENEKFDGILMDIHMPIMDGIECSKIIRENEKEFKNKSLIFSFTSSLYDSDVSSLFDGKVSKPIQPNDFLEMLKKIQK